MTRFQPSGRKRPPCRNGLLMSILSLYSALSWSISNALGTLVHLVNRTVFKLRMKLLLQCDGSRRLSGNEFQAIGPHTYPYRAANRPNHPGDYMYVGASNEMSIRSKILQTIQQSAKAVRRFRSFSRIKTMLQCVVAYMYCRKSNFCIQIISVVWTLKRILEYTRRIIFLHENENENDWPFVHEN